MGLTEGKIQYCLSYCLNTYAEIIGNSNIGEVGDNKTRSSSKIYANIDTFNISVFSKTSWCIMRLTE